jgi:hypothetical protein
VAFIASEIGGDFEFRILQASPPLLIESTGVIEIASSMLSRLFALPSTIQLFPEVALDN